MVRVNDLQMTLDSGIYTGALYSCEVETDEAELIGKLVDMANCSVFKRKKSSEDKNSLPKIKNVVFNDPATIVIWDDGTKTIVKADESYGDTFDKETGLAMAICKKAMGNKGNFNNVFKKWIWDKE